MKKTNLIKLLKEDVIIARITRVSTVEVNINKITHLANRMAVKPIFIKNLQLKKIILQNKKTKN